MSTFRSIATATVLSLSLVLASSAAFAGEKGGPGKLELPVAGATFKQHVEARLAKQSTRLEERIANDKIPADKAAEMRARFAERKAKVSAAVEKAVADGTVTKEEAKEVREAAGGHGRRHGEGRGHRGGNGKPALARARCSPNAVLGERGTAFRVSTGHPPHHRSTCWRAIPQTRRRSVRQRCYVASMLGFEGDPARAAVLRQALEALLLVFPEHLAKPPPATSFDGEARARDDLFEAIVRAHKRDRLALPVQALRATGAVQHGFSGMPLRRFAWFVPSVLASWLEDAASASVGESSIESAQGTAALVAMLDDLASDEPEQGWTDEEATALEAFFEAALDAAIASPLPAARATHLERPLEDGVRVWSLCSPSLPLDVLRVARAMGLSLEPLVIRWALDEPALALDHLLEAVFDTITASKHFLSHEAVADRLARGFFEAAGERARRLSKAEATVRRNIDRRGDY